MGRHEVSVTRRTFQSQAPNKLPIAQTAHDFGEIALLEKADGGDSGGSGVEASAGVCESDSPESEDRNAGLARLVEQSYSCWLGGRSVFLFEDRGEDGESRAIGKCLGHVCRRVTGNSNQLCSR